MLTLLMESKDIVQSRDFLMKEIWLPADSSLLEKIWTYWFLKSEKIEFGRKD
ncbi:MAG: hypothetical protein IPN79_06200 [Saprospiraceae bacterium]|nr:hypothetical protein [Saprospiraceae bacterium]